MDFKSIIAAFCFLIIILSIISVLPYQDDIGNVTAPSGLVVFAAVILILITGSYFPVFFSKKKWHPM